MNMYIYSNTEVRSRTNFLKQKQANITENLIRQDLNGIQKSFKRRKIVLNVKDFSVNDKEENKF